MGPPGKGPFVGRHRVGVAGCLWAAGTGTHAAVLWGSLVALGAGGVLGPAGLGTLPCGGGWSL